uniref:Tyrosine-protein kinase n=1 Tax=Neolamprologus brichardi TaxID=32507 RepID=A0A3Q4I330_NEOBR
MFPRVILKGTLIKKSQQKKRVSPCNYKERFFVLDTQDLKYSERRPGKKPLLKGCIELSRIKCVEIVCTDVPIPCSFKYPFQVFHDSYYLYIFAPDNDCRQKWVRALKEETKNNNLVPKYHPNFWMDGKWRCCQQTEKLATGCNVYDPVASKKPLPSLPEPEMELEDSGQQKVIALQNYTPQGDNDLPLQKDQEYLLVKNSHSTWWLVQDERGWYNKNISRAQAEELLMKEGKEGAFVVRDSRQAGVYTVSVFTKAPGSNGEKNPRVKHYQIRQTETSPASFYLAEKYLFSTIPELIYYHQHNAAGKCASFSHCGYFGSLLVCWLTDQWEVDPEELILGQEIGSGQFGLVLEGSWRDLKVAVKMVREECMSDEEFKEEARIMMRLSHSKLVQLYGVCTQHSPICLVFEYMENGCLTDYLREKKGSLSQDLLLGMCLDVSEGMAYLEMSNFIHRDLAARNCLVSKNNEVKVSDFGMTRFVLDDQYTSSQCSKFPVKWSAPEVIRYCKFSTKSDVWSFGVLMWEVYNEGRLPYENRTNAEVVDSLNAGLRLLKPRLAPDSVHLLMEWCWKEKPDDRPTFGLLFHELASLSDA